MIDRDVVIAGAGPAGIATAIALVQREPSLRERLVVLDRAKFPRNKPCGGGLTGHASTALAALQIDVPSTSVPSPNAIVRCGSFERSIVLEQPVAVIRRIDFDAALVDKARQLGIAIEEQRTVTRYAPADDRVRVETSRGPITTRVLVGAEGAASVVRKQLLEEKWGARRSAPQPIRLFRAELPDADVGRYSATMLYDFSPMADGLRGYFWIFPMPGGGVNVGLMHYPGSDSLTGKALVKMLDQRLARDGYALGGEARGWPVWGYRADLPLSRPGVLLVGDAAGVDALTGEGIAVGMEQALVAADAIMHALTTGDVRFANYRRAIRRATVGRELALDTRLAVLLYGGERWRQWLSLVLFDERLLALYAERVCGTTVLADQRAALVAAFVRHGWNWSTRRARLDHALAGVG